MAGYLSGKGYRENLNARPRQSSTPAARETPQFPRQAPHFPVTTHRTPPSDHKETVGWRGNKFHDRTTPNADSRTGTDRIYARKAPKHETFARGAKDSEPQRRGRTSLKG